MATLSDGRVPYNRYDTPAAADVEFGMGNAVFLLFILLVAAANLCIGFGVAVYLGYGPKRRGAAAPAAAGAADERH